MAHPQIEFMRAWNLANENRVGFTMMGIQKLDDIIEHHSVRFQNPGSGIAAPRMRLSVDGVDYYREIENEIWWTTVEITLEPCAEKFIRSMAGPMAVPDTVRVVKSGAWPPGMALLTCTCSQAISRPMLSLVNYQESVDLVDGWIREAMAGKGEQS